MKIDRLTCITQIDNMIAEGKAEHEQANEALAARYDTEVKAWRKDEAKALSTSLRELAVKATKGVLVTDNDIETACGMSRFGSRRGARSLVWSGSTEPPTPREYRQPEKLIRLRAVLAASPDEFITTSALREFGFNPAIFITGMNA